MKILRSGRGLDRLVNFSDATVAIAITLMILPLVDSAQELGELTVRRFVDVHGGELFAFFLSFWIIARYWMIHHRLFELVRDYSPMLIRLNTLWLATVVFIPFGQSAISVTDTGRSDLNILYISCLAALSASTLSLEFYLQLHPDLLDPDADERVVPSLTASGLLLLALVMSILVPTSGPWWLFLLLAQGPIDRLIRRVRRRTARHTARNLTPPHAGVTTVDDHRRDSAS